MHSPPTMIFAALVIVTGCVGTAPDGSDDRPAPADAHTAGDAGPNGEDAAQADAGGNAHDAMPGALELAREDGCFFTAPATGPAYERLVGQPGVAYRWITIEYDVIHGGWREELFDRPVINHNLMGLTRNVSTFAGRYILGNAAQMQPGTPGLSRKSLYYGRVDLQTKPPGEGYTGYIGWRTEFSWRAGRRYHVRARIDAQSRRQRLDVVAEDGTTATTTGDIPYYDASLSEATFTLQLGGEDSDGREVRAVGWQFCDLVVAARRE